MIVANSVIVANSQPLIASRLNIVIEKCNKEKDPLICIHHRNLRILLLSQTNTPNSILHSSSSHTLHIIEIRMVQCLLAIDSSLRIIRQKTLPSITSPHIIILRSTNPTHCYPFEAPTRSMGAVYTHSASTRSIQDTYSASACSLNWGIPTS